MVRGTLAPGDGPTSGSSGKMLSTSLLYLGRRAPQQPHTPGTGTRMPCELSLPGPGWVASEKPNPGWKQKGPSVRAPGPQSFLLFPHPTPTLRHCLSCLVSFAWGSGISRCQQIRICSGSKAIEHTCACTRTHTHIHTHSHTVGQDHIKLPLAAQDSSPGPGRSSSWEEQLLHLPVPSCFLPTSPL